MKVLLYQEGRKYLGVSGIGRALKHQQKALNINGIETTFDRRDTYDFVHINTIFPESYRFLRKCQKKHIPVVVHGHSTYEDFRNSFRGWKLMEPIFDILLKRIYQHADFIITPTPYSKNLIENYKGVKCPVKAISNGIILEDYKYNEQKAQDFKNYFKIKPNQKVVIGVGLLFERKGLIDFIEVAKSMPDVTFIWFGNLQKSLTQFKILKAMKEKPSNVILPGYISGDVIKGAFSSANAMFFPSYEETEGIVVLEALASRLPLIVRDIGVYKPWLENGVNCYVGKNNDEFIQIIQKTLNSDNSKIIDNGYNVAEERSIDKIGKELIDTYKEVEKICISKINK